MRGWPDPAVPRAISAGPIQLRQRNRPRRPWAALCHYSRRNGDRADGVPRGPSHFAGAAMPDRRGPTGRSRGTRQPPAAAGLGPGATGGVRRCYDIPPGIAGAPMTKSVDPSRGAVNGPYWGLLRFIARTQRLSASDVAATAPATRTGLGTCQTPLSVLRPLRTLCGLRRRPVTEWAGQRPVENVRPSWSPRRSQRSRRSSRAARRPCRRRARPWCHRHRPAWSPR